MPPARGNGADLRREIRELRQQLANFHDPILHEDIGELRELVEGFQKAFEPLFALGSTVKARVSFLEQGREIDHVNFMSAVLLSKNAVQATDMLKTEYEQLRRLVQRLLVPALGSAPAPAPPQPPLQETQASDQPSAVSGPVSPQGWLPPGAPPQLIYLGRALDQSDLTIVHSWYRRLGAGVVAQGRYNAEEYRRDVNGRTRVEIRDGAPPGFLHGWTLTRTDDTFGYFVPEATGPGWPAQLKLHHNAEKDIFIAAIVHENVGPRPSQDPNVLQSFHPQDVTEAFNVLSLFWEKASGLPQTPDLVRGARAVVAISDEFRKHWEAASETIAQSVTDHFHQKTLTDMLQDERNIRTAVENIVEQRATEEDLRQNLELLLQASQPNWEQTQYVLRGIISHELSDGQSVNTDVVEMFRNPFVRDLLVYGNAASDGAGTAGEN
ncbi:uncharacterized protein Z520_07018 [Fonsecaea multimorphosa CBS 102226]|uniref:Uncharacterized protein n=1 Tax=Fonsecaea multimorphosa CBS 102226 TaxID=1442371 RepID=A0A0D2H6S7_9EURO|nr:uncharacterized protein Z520_07018 [Fonsecaea multimorphosa CBS 102226]KIX97565.1 hypothetical protein Z520_07018 [Fonsecaea multimorphosa CBS 102226]OAL23522.1 hypothetical protein AYO22_06572 [Fonsecaea multimorphosa]